MSRFSGEASAYWQKKVDAFESLRVSGPNQEPDRERIVAAGIALYEQKRDADLQRECRERVFGRDVIAGGVASRNPSVTRRRMPEGTRCLY